MPMENESQQRRQKEGKSRDITDARLFARLFEMKPLRDGRGTLVDCNKLVCLDSRRAAGWRLGACKHQEPQSDAKCGAAGQRLFARLFARRPVVVAMERGRAAKSLVCAWCTWDVAFAIREGRARDGRTLCLFRSDGNG